MKVIDVDGSYLARKHQQLQVDGVNVKSLLKIWFYGIILIEIDALSQTALFTWRCLNEAEWHRRGYYACVYTLNAERNGGVGGRSVFALPSP